MADDKTEDTTTTEGKRWAVYNTTLGRFVGGVTDKKPTKKDAEALVPQGHDTEVREI